MFWITYAAALLSILLMVGAVAFLLSRRNTELARALALYCITAAFWIGGNAAADVSYTVSALIAASEVAYLGGALNLFLFLVLVDLIIDRHMPSRLRLLLYGIPVIGMSTFAFSDYAIMGTYFPGDSPAQIIPGPLYLATLFILLAALGYSVARLAIALAKESGETRKIELSYVLLGLMLSLAGEIVFDVVLPLLGELRFYTLGPISSLFFVGGCAYIITKRHLFDIRLALQRSMVFGFLLVLILGVYVGLLSLVLLLSPLESENAIYMSAGITTVLGIFGAPLITRIFTRATDRVFFKDTYDLAEALRMLSEILYRHVELAELIGTAESALTRILRAESVRIEYGAGGIDSPDLDAVADDRVIAVPIRSNDAYIGSIHAGPKRSGDSYTPQDRKLLETFAFQAATAFSRAELYEKTKRHANELAQMVEERTQELRAVQAHERQTLIDLSHNLQTPLAVFQVRLEQLKQGALGRDAIRSLEQPMRRLSDFIYDLLALAKLESERPAGMTANISSLLEEIVEEVGVIAENEHIAIESAVTPGIEVQGDAKRLREAVMNVAGNALRYMDEGERRISFALARENGMAVLTITDTGRGIPTDDLPHVFERFYRRKDPAGLPNGSGLGLAIVHRIIEQHGGYVDIESEAGCGTTVSIRLPLTQS